MACWTPPWSCSAKSPDPRRSPQSKYEMLPTTFLPVDLHRWDRGPAADVLAVPVWSDLRPLRGAAGLLDWRLCGRLSQLLREGRLCGALGNRLLPGGPAPARRQLAGHRLSRTRHRPHPPRPRHARLPGRPRAKRARSRRLAVTVDRDRQGLLGQESGLRLTGRVGFEIIAECGMVENVVGRMGWVMVLPAPWREDGKHREPIAG
jgi:hypothetical protein